MTSSVQPVVLRQPPPKDTDILSALVEQGRAVRSDCGGRGACGKCRVLVHSADDVSPANEAERHLLSPDELHAGYRLACQARFTGSVSVSVPQDSRETREALGKTNIHGTIPVNPIVRRVALDPTVATGDTCRDIVSYAGSIVGDSAIAQHTNPIVLADLSSYWGSGSPFTLVHHLSKGITRILNGEQTKSLGFAFDIGTTTVAGYLCDLVSGRILAASGTANPQRRYGEDVISRIQYAFQEREGTRSLKELVIVEVNRIIDDCLKKASAERGDIDELVVVGNTTMQHLFCGMNPTSLGRAPYQPLTVCATDWRALDLQIDVHPSTNVHLFPVISGFVGGDTVAAVVSQKLDSPGDVSMLVDIGTNGEVVLSCDGELWATSCATGPALEGAHISSGMRAIPGAIEKVWIDPGDLRVKYHALGEENGAKVCGLCGSGIIDAVAEMHRNGLILANGRLNESIPGIASDSKGIGRTFTLVQADSTANGRPIQVTLDDVRQIQLAKGAMAAGIRLLMKVAGVDRVDRLILTGAFGARFNWKNAAFIGMLPPNCVAGTVETVENAAGLGAMFALVDKNCRERALRVSDTTKVLELAEHPEFQMEFLSALDFPDVPSAASERSS